MSRPSLVDRFHRHVCPTSRSPLGLEIERAEGSRVFDVAGRDYVDLLAGMGVANVGHRHPEVVAAIGRQSELYLHAMVYGEYVQGPQVALAARLASLLPPALSMAYFTSSGAEAIEGALKTARKRTGRRRFVAFEGGFHGDTFGALSIGGNPVYRRPFEPLLPEVTFLPFGADAPLGSIDEGVAAVVVEPIQGEGGVRIPDAGFLGALRARCDATGAMLVFDEVVTAFGRTGRLFGFEHSGVIPDVLVLAKALGGGMPLGAFVSSPDILSTLAEDPPLAHVTTFGGHPVSCGAGLAALEVCIRDELPERARIVGHEMRTRLAALPWRGRLREIRGVGLLIGLELVDADVTRAFAARAFAERVILNWTLHRDRVIRLAPPLTISGVEMDDALERLERALAG